MIRIGEVGREMNQNSSLTKSGEQIDKARSSTNSTGELRSPELNPRVTGHGRERK